MIYTVGIFNHMFVSVDMPRNAYNESHVNIVIFLKLKDACTGPVLSLHVFVMPSVTQGCINPVTYIYNSSCC